MLLRHWVRLGTVHYDLMLSTKVVPECADDRCMITFRIERRPCWTDPVSVPVERIDDHRAHYLTFEGDLSGDRGAVHRTDRFMVRWIEMDPEALGFEVIHDAGIARCSVNEAADGSGAALNVRPAGGAGR